MVFASRLMGKTVADSPHNRKVRKPRITSAALFFSTIVLAACRGSPSDTQPDAPAAKPAVESRLAALDQAAPAQPAMKPTKGTGDFVGFDRNGYPGDGRLAELHSHFAFMGYWLNNPPGAKQNGWFGKRQQLRD